MRAICIYATSDELNLQFLTLIIIYNQWQKIIEVTERLELNQKY
jgi:hypothetical protein